MKSKGVLWFFAIYTVAWGLAYFTSIKYVSNHYKAKTEQVALKPWENDWVAIKGASSVYLYSDLATPTLPPFPCHTYYGVTGVYAFPTETWAGIKELIDVMILDIEKMEKVAETKPKEYEL